MDRSRITTNKDFLWQKWMDLKSIKEQNNHL